MLIPAIAASDGPQSGQSSSVVPLRVRFGETDLMGIVHHANYLLYVEEARVEYLRRRGVRYEEWVARDIHFAVVDARIRYRAASLFGDALEIETWVGSASRVSLRFDYRIRRSGGSPLVDGARSRVIADAYTTLACVDSSRTPRRIPAEVLELIAKSELTAVPA